MVRCSTPIVKVTRPSARNVHHRERLFKLLDTATEKPIIWICSPAGSGKTALVSSWLDSRNLSSLWYQVDEGDSDISTFFYYMGLAAKKDAGFKKPLPLLTPEYLQGVPTFTRRFFEEIYRQMLGRGGPADRPHVVVLDNFQEASGQGFQDVVREALSIIPDGIMAVVISRSGPPPAFARLIANGMVGTIEWNQIRLTLEESGHILRMKTSRVIDKETVRQYHEKAGGWAAGIILLMQETGRRKTDTVLEGRLISEKVFDYFAGEILDKVDTTLRQFMLKTAFLPEVTAHTAERLTGMADACRILERLCRNNYFTQRRRDKKSIYQFNPLFRDFLQARAKEELSKLEIRNIQSQAGSLLEETDRIEDAAELYIKAGAWEGLARLVMTHAFRLIWQGRSATLERWIAAMPGEARVNEPWLLYWQGMCCAYTDPHESRIYCEKAFTIFESRKESAGVFLASSGVVQSHLMAYENFTLMDPWIAGLDDLLSRYSGFPSKEIETHTASIMFAALVMRQSNHPQFDYWLQKALSTPDTNQRILTLFYLSFYYCYNGETRKLQIIVDEMRRLSMSPEITPFGTIMSKMAEIFYFMLECNPKRCLEICEEGLSIAQKSGVHLMDFFLLQNSINCELNSGMLSSANEHLERQTKYLYRMRPWEECGYHLMMGWRALLRGAPSEAKGHSELALSLALMVGSTSSEFWVRLLLVCIYQRLGETEKCEEQLDFAHGLAVKTNSFLHQFEYYLIRADFEFERDEVSALVSLRKAIAIGKEKDIYNSFYIWQPLAMSRLFAKALEEGIEVEYVKEVIRRHNLNPPVTLIDKSMTGEDRAENWPWPVKVHTLGGFSLLLDGKPVESSGKIQKKPLEMLKALIAFGCEAVSVEKISDALWPDAEGDDARNSFKTNLARLRKLLQHEVLFLIDGSLTLDKRHCWVDVCAFEQAYRRVESAFREGAKVDHSDQTILLAEKALSLYGGPFLPHDDGVPWTTDMREMTHHKYMNLLERLGQFHEERGDHNKAIDCYRRGIESDRLQELFYRGLMTCYQSLGRNAEAASVYHGLKKTLADNLDILPSAETERVYQKVKK